MRKVFLPVMAYGLLAQTTPAQNPAAKPVIPHHDLMAQSKRLSIWWPGEYDNHEQIVRQSGGGLSPLTASPFHRLHSMVQSVQAPQLGRTVYWISQYRDNDPSRITRNELAIVDIDPASAALRMRRFDIPDAALLKTPAALKIEQLRPLGSACDVMLRYVGGQFEGEVVGKCAASSAGKPGDAVVIGQDFVWERERTQERAWYQQSRTHPFTCNVFSSAGKMADAQYLTTIHLHDQGGEADIAWPDGRTLTFTIHQRAFSSPTEREYPIFRIHEKGNPVPIAYGYGVDATPRFGLNLGWFYIRCYDDRDITAADMGEARR